MAEIFGILSGLVILVGAPSYLIDILKGKTKPQRTTWLIWSVLGVIAFISQSTLGGRWSLVYVGLSAVGNLIVYGLALKYGVGGWTATDKMALVIAVIGVGVSLVTSRPLIALLGVVLADLSGTVLTIRKTFRAPRSETTITWIALGTAGLLTALAVGHRSFELLLYPVYLALTCYGVLLAKYAGLTMHATNRGAKRP